MRDLSPIAPRPQTRLRDNGRVYNINGRIGNM